MKTQDLRREREERRRREYHRLILEAAERVIVRKGTSAMTMDDVAREAEFSKATIYHYFRSKGELVLELLGNFFDQVDMEARKITALKCSARDKMERAIRFYLQFNREKENVSRMLMMDPMFMKKMRNFISEEKDLASEMDRKFITKVKMKRKDILDGVAGILRQGVASGEFRRLNIPDAVVFLDSLLQGYCHVRYWHDRPYSVKEATGIFHSYFLQGIERKGGPAKGESK
jgi:AcrR family transcriptional regulator